MYLLANAKWFFFQISSSLILVYSSHRASLGQLCEIIQLQEHFLKKQSAKSITWISKRNLNVCILSFVFIGFVQYINVLEKTWKGWDFNENYSDFYVIITRNVNFALPWLSWVVSWQHQGCLLWELSDWKFLSFN